MGLRWLWQTDRKSSGGYKTSGCWRASSRPSSVSKCHIFTILTRDFRAHSHALSEWLPSCSVLQPLTLTLWSLISLWWAGPPWAKKWWSFHPPNLYSSSAVGDICETVQDLGLHDFLDSERAFDKIHILLLFPAYCSYNYMHCKALINLWSRFKGFSADSSAGTHDVAFSTTPAQWRYDYLLSRSERFMV